MTLLPFLTSLTKWAGVWRLADLRGEKNVVLYFYPMARTPGCTAQACGIRDTLADFTQLKTEVLGISADPEHRQQKFTHRYQLNFPLLCDPRKTVIKQYGAWRGVGPGEWGIGMVSRVTFIIGRDGTIKHIMRKVTSRTHHQVVLDWVRQHMR